jgi:hypothetical protein
VNMLNHDFSNETRDQREMLEHKCLCLAWTLWPVIGALVGCVLGWRGI